MTGSDDPPLWTEGGFVAHVQPVEGNALIDLPPARR